MAIKVIEKTSKSKQHPKANACIDRLFSEHLKIKQFLCDHFIFIEEDIMFLEFMDQVKHKCVAKNENLEKWVCFDIGLAGTVSLCFFYMIERQLSPEMDVLMQIKIFSDDFFNIKYNIKTKKINHFQAVWTYIIQLIENEMSDNFENFLKHILTHRNNYINEKFIPFEPVAGINEVTPIYYLYQKSKNMVKLREILRKVLKRSFREHEAKDKSGNNTLTHAVMYDCYPLFEDFASRENLDARNNDGMRAIDIALAYVSNSFIKMARKFNSTKILMDKSNKYGGIPSLFESFTKNVGNNHMQVLPCDIAKVFVDAMLWDDASYNGYLTEKNWQVLLQQTIICSVVKPEYHNHLIDILRADQGYMMIPDIKRYEKSKRKVDQDAHKKILRHQTLKRVLEEEVIDENELKKSLDQYEFQEIPWGLLLPKWKSHQKIMVDHWYKCNQQYFKVVSHDTVEVEAIPDEIWNSFLPHFYNKNTVEYLFGVLGLSDLNIRMVLQVMPKFIKEQFYNNYQIRNCFESKELRLAWFKNSSKIFFTLWRGIDSFHVEMSDKKPLIKNGLEMLLQCEDQGLRNKVFMHAMVFLANKREQVIEVYNDFLNVLLHEDLYSFIHTQDMNYFNHSMVDLFLDFWKISHEEEKKKFIIVFDKMSKKYAFEEHADHKKWSDLLLKIVRWQTQRQSIEKIIAEKKFEAKNSEHYDKGLQQGLEYSAELIKIHNDENIYWQKALTEEIADLEKINEDLSHKATSRETAKQLILLQDRLEKTEALIKGEREEKKKSIAKLQKQLANLEKSNQEKVTDKERIEFNMDELKNKYEILEQKSQMDERDLQTAIEKSKKLEQEVEVLERKYAENVLDRLKSEEEINDLTMRNEQLNKELDTLKGKMKKEKTVDEGEKRKGTVKRLKFFQEKLKSLHTNALPTKVVGALLHFESHVQSIRVENKISAIKIYGMVADIWVHNTFCGYSKVSTKDLNIKIIIDDKIDMGMAIEKMYEKLTTGGLVCCKNSENISRFKPGFSADMMGMKFDICFEHDSKSAANTTQCSSLDIEITKNITESIWSVNQNNNYILYLLNANAIWPQEVLEKEIMPPKRKSKYWSLSWVLRRKALWNKEEYEDFFRKYLQSMGFDGPLDGELFNDIGKTIEKGNKHYSKSLEWLLNVVGAVEKIDAQSFFANDKGIKTEENFGENRSNQNSGKTIW